MLIRWQDWTNVVLGCWLIASPWELEYSLNKAATGNACGLGAVLVMFNLISAARLLDQGQEILNIILGIWLILSPYLLGFAVEREPATNAILVGLMVLGLAAWQIYDATRTGKS